MECQIIQHNRKRSASLDEKRSFFSALYLLKDLYGQVSIPTAVKEEVTRKNDSVKAELESSDWIHVEPVTNSASKWTYGTVGAGKA